MFKEIEAKPAFPKLEEEVLKFWKEKQIFKKSLKKTEGKKPFVFYEGPPTANGRPGIHHVLARAFKDLFPRYHTMKGEYCLRKGGWDTHGLPVELAVEKELGLSGKKEIEEYGIEKFNAKCKESVFRYVKEWEELTDRMGFWIDMEDPYVTLDNDYIESCWWILKQYYDKGLLVKDYKVVPYCPRCGTPLSSHEVAQGYEEVEDPSIFVKFRLKPLSKSALIRKMQEAESIRTHVEGNHLEKDFFFLAWTTTPWTLPGNVALAVKPDHKYHVFYSPEEDGVLVFSRDALENSDAIQPGMVLIGTIWGSDMVGLEYKRLFESSPENSDSHKIVTADFVTLEEGTGIVHTAVMYGVDDFNLGTKLNLPKDHTVDEEGKFKERVKEFKGIFVKEADPKIIKNLKERGLLFKQEKYLHSYPFCWRCHGPLLYYAYETWFIKTTEKKDELLVANNAINWVPDHIKQGRMGNWLETLVDWALSRSRYWGTPLPIWVCKECGDTTCVGGIKDLEVTAKSRESIPDDLHRPFIDNVILKCSSCGGDSRRVEDVIDVWFDSGAMPLAQWGYPHKEGSKQLFKGQFPADYICEAMDQTRGWFFTLLAESTLLYERPPYKNVVSLGLVLDTKGKKMSKHVGNVINPWDVIEKTGIDAIRWYFYSSTTAGNVYNFGYDPVEDVIRRFFLTFWNSYKFFVTYANLDNWTPESFKITGSLSVLDKWLLSKLNSLVGEITASLDQFDAFKATRGIEKFVNDFSVWYIRLSRNRVGPAADDEEEKEAFYQTSYFTLLTMAKILAPLAPFLAENIYRSLATSGESKESVHLEDWPEYDKALIDVELEDDMEVARKIVTIARARRKAHKIKVRQPLSLLEYVYHKKLSGEIEDLIASETNVKRIEYAKYGSKGEGEPVVSLNVSDIPDILKQEGEARDLIRKIQNLRKKANCRLDEKIVVYAPSWPEHFEDDIRKKTLAERLEVGDKLEIKQI